MSWGTQDRQQRRYYCFHVRDYYPLGSSFPASSINRIFFNFSHINTKLSPYNPDHKLYTQSVIPIKMGIQFFVCTVCDRFGLFRFRSPLLTKCRPCGHCFLFLLVLKCFTSQGMLLTSSVRFYSKVEGFPIRRSPDQRLLGTSPKLIAATLRPSSLFRAKASTIYS